MRRKALKTDAPVPYPSPLSPHANVAIVGGGYAGMAAAVELTARNIPVTVFEAGPLPGGRARRVAFEGVALDNGLHILIGAYRETLRLIRLVNPQHASALQRMPLDWHIHREFRLATPRLPAPLHVLTGLLSAEGVGWNEKIGAVRFMLAMRRNRFMLPSSPTLLRGGEGNSPRSLGKGSGVREMNTRRPADITVAQLLEDHRQSEKLCRVLWHPLCVAALNTPAEIASAQIFLNVLRDTLNGSRAASDLLLARVDLSALFPEPAAAWITERGGTVRTATRVTAIEPIEDGFTITVGDSRSASTTYSHVICAVPPHQVNAFLIGITALSEIADSIERLRYQPIHSVWLQYPQSVTLPSPMLGFSQGILHWVFDRETLCGQRGLVGAVISASGAHLQMTQHELAAAVQLELVQALGPLPDPTWTRVIAEKRATFSCTPGLQRPPSTTPLRNFYLAGDYTESAYPATIEAAVMSGIACASQISSQGHL